MTSKTDIVEQKLNELRQSFRNQLPERIGFIETTVKSLSLSSDNSDRINLLHRNVHSLSGSGGTFGYTRLSAKASGLEEFLLSLSDQKRLDAQDLETIALIFNDIKELSDQEPDAKKISFSQKNQSATIDVVTSKQQEDTDQKLVYIVEDDRNLAQELGVRLKQFGYKTVCFLDAESAAAAASEKIPFAVLADVMLSESSLSGPELVQHLNIFKSSIPVVFMSARKDWEIRLACVRAGGTAYLPKPIKINEMVTKLDSLANLDSEDAFHVLIVDDVEVLARHYALILEQAGMQTTVVTDVSKLLDVLGKNKPELILMDLYMPGSSGIEAAEVIRQIDEYLDVPIVFLSTERHIGQKMQAMKMGGDDFLQKPINDEYLVEAVTLRARRFRHLRTVMERDGLTGLTNRIGLDLDLEREISRAERERSNVIFAMIDVDHFKNVNDQYGHQAGDNVLKTMARLLTQRLRKSDIIGRYGGEEFGVILPNTELDQALKIMNEIRGCFSLISHASESGSFNVTFSSGLAMYPAYHNSKLIVQAADKALYAAKESGRNCVVCDRASLELNK